MGTIVVATDGRPSDRELATLLQETLVRSRIFRMALASSLVAFTLAIYSIAGRLPPLLLMAVLAVEGLLNQPYRWLIACFPNQLLRVLYLQLTIDIVAVTAFLHYAGGIEALLLNTAYFLPIVFGGILVSINISVYTAILSSLAYSLLVFGEYFGWIPHVATFGIQMPLAQQVLFVCISIFFFNLSGYFTAYPARILHDQRRALALAKQEVEQWNVRLTQRIEEKTEELRTTYEQLVESEKLAVLGQFTAGLTHEIDNPLTIISGRAESLLLRGDLDPKIEHALKTVLSQARRAGEMTSQLLTISRPLELRLEPLALNALLEETLEGVSFRPEFDHVQIVKTLAPSLPAIHGDRKRLIEVFSNLFNNAAQAMPQGGALHVRSRYALAAPANTRAVLIEIEDTGNGIAPEHLPKLFTPFFTTKDVGKGTGLGLFVTHGIVRKHGGTITVESHVHRGTRFTVALPVWESDEALATPHAATSQQDHR